MKVKTIQIVQSLHPFKESNSHLGWSFKQQNKIGKVGNL